MNANQIRKWMRANVHHFVDSCNEVNCTVMVETYDIECASGNDTLADTDHPAWDIAVEIGEEYEREHSK